jgi:hypothetical protein
MLTIFNNWLNDNSQAEGILGAGVRYSDKTVFIIPRETGPNRDTVENICQTVADVFQTFKLRKVTAPRLTWKFEKGTLYSAMRSDGNCLCLLATEKVQQEELDRIFYEFQTLWG